MSATSVRCANCGKRLSPSTGVCPACGADQPMHVRRIRCHYCSRRVPADSIVCPYCKHNPRGFYLRLRAVVAPVAILALVALGYAAVNPSMWINALSIPGTITPTATTRAAATRVTALVVTATLAASTVPASHVVPSPTMTESPPVTMTQTATPTPTPRPVKPTAPSAPPPPPPPPTAAPSPTGYPPPVLQSPSSGAKLSGRKQAVLLSFGSPVTLMPDEWFRVEVIFKDPAGNFANWCGWTKDNTIRFPIPYYDDSWPFDRTFRWNVSIAKAQADMPSTCQAISNVVSSSGQEWIFYWY